MNFTPHTRGDTPGKNKPQAFLLAAPGDAAEQAEKIFDRFTKLNEFVQGTGLGLSICRDIATRMGGRVFLDTSYTAGGARFVLALPIEPPTDNQS